MDIVKKPKVYTIEQVLKMKPSKILQLVLNDIKYVENLENVEIRMSTWVETNPFNNNCFVCAAGAFIRYNLNDTRNNIQPYENCDYTLKVSEEVSTLMYVINYFRTGNVINACAEFSTISTNDTVKKRMFDTKLISLNVFAYSYGSDIFKKDFEFMIKYLKSKKL